MKIINLDMDMNERNIKEVMYYIHITSPAGDADLMRSALEEIVGDTCIVHVSQQGNSNYFVFAKTRNNNNIYCFTFDAKGFSEPYKFSRFLEWATTQEEE